VVEVVGWSVVEVGGWSVVEVGGWSVVEVGGSGVVEVGGWSVVEVVGAGVVEVVGAGLVEVVGAGVVEVVGFGVVEEVVIGCEVVVCGQDVKTFGLISVTLRSTPKPPAENSFISKIWPVAYCCSYVTVALLSFPVVTVVFAVSARAFSTLSM
jgi:hypothetical protein